MKPANKSSSLASEENDNLVKALVVGPLCALGGGLPLPVKNALKYFEGELGGGFQVMAEELGEPEVQILARFEIICIR